MRETVAVLYVVGALMTVAGVLRAFFRAKGQKRRLDDIKLENDRLVSSDALAAYEAPKNGDDESVAAMEEQRADVDAQVKGLLEQTGISDPPPSLNDMRLPAAFWSLRITLADSILQFRNDGALALAGLIGSTVASVWSLYLG